MMETTELTGEALVAAVAEKVMGWQMFQMNDLPVWMLNGASQCPCYHFRPDLNIAQAWEAKDRMIQLGYDFDYEEEPSHGENPIAGFIKAEKSWYVQDANPCMAMIRAALAAVEAR